MRLLSLLMWLVGWLVTYVLLAVAISIENAYNDTRLGLCAQCYQIKECKQSYEQRKNEIFQN